MLGLQLLQIRIDQRIDISGVSKGSIIGQIFPSHSCSKILISIPQNGIFFGDRDLTEMIKLKWDNWNRPQYNVLVFS